MAMQNSLHKRQNDVQFCIGTHFFLIDRGKQTSFLIFFRAERINKPTLNTRYQRCLVATK